MSGEYSQMLNFAIAAADRREYAAALQILQRVYRTTEPETIPQGLSSYGLCLANVEGKRKLGIALCVQATQLEPNEGRHWANLVRLYIGAGDRRKAVETLDDTLSRLRNNPALLRVREEIGYRKAPSLSFLPRTHPLNKLYSLAVGKLKRILNFQRRRPSA